MIGMSQGRGGPAVVLRASAAATTTLALATGGHVLAGGTAPATNLVLAIAAVTVVTALPLSRRRLRAASLLSWTISMQLVVHLSLSWLVGEPSATVMSTAHHAPPTAGALGAIDAAGQHAMTPGAAMLLGHLLATLLSVALLVGVDRGVSLLGALWRRHLDLVGTVPRSFPDDRSHAAPGHNLRAHGRRPGIDVLRRGPPLLRTA